MAIIEDVEVQIVSTATDQVLTEYDDPDPDAVVALRKIEKSIQAETNDEFYILVTLKQGFDYYGADGIRIGFNMDGGMLSRSKFYTRPSRIQRFDDG